MADPERRAGIRPVAVLIEATAAGIRLRLHVQPRASRTELSGRHGDALKLRVAAPPVEGAANAAVAALLAGALRLRASAVSIEHGARGRDKLVRVAGLTLADIRRRLEGGAS